MVAEIFQGKSTSLVPSHRVVDALVATALLLIAWEDLTPSQAARALGIHPAAFRVRLLRARRRLRASLTRLAPSDRPPAAVSQLDVEGT